MSAKTSKSVPNTGNTDSQPFIDIYILDEDDEESDDESDTSNNNKEEDIDTFDKKLPSETIKLIRDISGAKVYLVGTCHYSIKSQYDVSKVIRTVQPDIVVIELCRARVNALELTENEILERAESWDHSKTVKSIYEKGVIRTFLALQDIRMIRELKRAPGGEFRRALYEVRRLNNCELRLGDRPFGITFARFVSQLTWMRMWKCFWCLVSRTPTTESQSDYVENILQPDEMKRIESLLTEGCPDFMEVFLDERNRFLTYSLQNAAIPIVIADGVKYPKVVGVVGLMHVEGIIELWPISQAPFIPQIMTIPSETFSSKVIRITINLITYIIVGYVIIRYVIPGVIYYSYVIIKCVASVTGKFFKFCGWLVYNLLLNV